MNHLENDLSNTQVLLNSDQSLWPETTRANSLDISLLAWMAWNSTSAVTVSLSAVFLAHLVSSPVRRARTGCENGMHCRDVQLLNARMSCLV